MKARVFTKDGNRFITPLYAGVDENEANAADLPAAMFALMSGIESTSEYLDVEDGMELQNVQVRLRSQGFAHGAIDMICVGGPMLIASLLRSGDFAGTARAAQVSMLEDYANPDR